MRIFGLLWARLWHHQNTRELAPLMDDTEQSHQLDYVSVPTLYPPSCPDSLGSSRSCSTSGIHSIDGFPRSRRSYKRLGLRLFTTGTYAVVKEPDAPVPKDFDYGKHDQTHRRNFNYAATSLNYIPCLSGQRRNLLQLLVILIAALGHWQTVKYVQRSDHPAPASVWSGVLGILMAKSTSFLTSQELRRIGQQVSNSGATLKWHRRSILANKCLILLLIAPLTSLPVFRASEIRSGVASNVDEPLYVDWDDIGANLLEPFIDSANMYQEAFDHELLLHQIERFDRWEVWSDNLTAALPNTMRFIKTQGATDYSPLGVAAAGLGVLRPFLPRLSPSLVLQKELPKTVQWVRSGYLECQKLDVAPGLQLLHNGTSGYAEANLVDDSGCGRTLTMRATNVPIEQLEEVADFAKEYDEYLSSLSRNNRHDARLVEMIDMYRKRLTEYTAELRESPKLVAFDHTWAVAQKLESSVTDASCGRRLLVAAFPDPLTSIAADGKIASKLQAASCTTNFQDLKVHVRAATPFLRGSFHQRSARYRHEDLTKLHIRPWTPASPLDDIGFFDPHYEDDKAAYAPWGKPFLVDRASYFHRTIDEYLALAISRVEFSSRPSYRNLFQYQFLVLTTLEEDAFHAIAYSTQRLMACLIRAVSVAASITLDESQSLKSPVPKKSTQQLVTDMHLVVLQASTWFQTLYLFANLSSVMLVALSYCLADYSPSGLPWDVSSIAAQASLLCHSRLRPIFTHYGLGGLHMKRLRPLRIGLWVDQESKSQKWSADSLLNVCGTSVNHSSEGRAGLPLCARPSVIGICVTVLCSTIAILWAALHHIRNVDYNDTEHSNIIPIILGVSTRATVSFSHQWSLLLMPAIVCTGLIAWLLEDLATFYKRRMPWVELRKHNGSTKALTLNYMNRWMPVLPAHRNNHFMLATTLVTSTLLTGLPVLLVNFHRPEWVQHSKPALIVTRNQSWSLNATTIDSTVMSDVLQQTWVAVSNSSALPRWSSYRGALLPVDLGQNASDNGAKTINPGFVGLWEMDTEMIRGEFDCLPLAAHRETAHDGMEDRWHSLGETPFTVHLPDKRRLIDGSSALLVDPCFVEDPTLDGGKRPDFSGSCGRWQAVSLMPESPDSKSLWWLISFVQARGSVPLRRALLCEPKTYMGTGVVELLSSNGRLGDSIVYSYASKFETSVESDIDSVLSESLASALSSRNSSMGGTTQPSLNGLNLLANTVRFSSSSFRGDLVSAMLHRWAGQEDLNLADGQILADVSSRLFATIFAIAVQRTGFLTSTEEATEVEIVPKVWTERLAISKPLVCMVVLGVTMLASVLIAHAVTMLRDPKYSFPFSPEPLEHSWIYLSKGPLVQQLQDHLTKQPHEMSFREFHSQVERLGGRYMLQGVDGRARGGAIEPLDLVRLDSSHEYDSQEELVNEGQGLLGRL